MKNKIFRVFFFALAVSALLLTCACGFAGPDNGTAPVTIVYENGEEFSTGKASDGWASVKYKIIRPGDYKTVVLGGDPVSMIDAGYMVYSSPAEIIDDSSYIVVGTIIGFDFVPSVYDQMYNAGSEASTIYYLEVSETLFGQPKTGENGLIKIHTWGGAIGDDGSEFFPNNTYDFTVGNQYVFFLKDPNLEYLTAEKQPDFYDIVCVYTAGEIDYTYLSDDLELVTHPYQFDPYRWEMGVESISYNELKERVAHFAETGSAQW